MIREFTVRPVLNGYIVSIGCKTLVFSSRERLVRNIERYLEDPTGTERDFLENSLNAKHLGSVRVPPELRPAFPQPYDGEGQAPAPDPERF